MSEFDLLDNGFMLRASTTHLDPRLHVYITAIINFPSLEKELQESQKKYNV